MSPVYYLSIFSFLLYNEMYQGCNCGSLGDVRIIGGEEVPAYSYGFQASILIGRRGSYILCGGTLVAIEWVLTAAHCLQSNPKPWDIRIALGKHDLSMRENNSQTIRGYEYIIHEEWDIDTYHNDIALIRLFKNATLDEYVKLAVLPTGEDDYAGTLGTILGWGLTEHNRRSSVLRRVNVGIISNSECGSWKELQPLISSVNICTSGEGMKGGCNGDSGGPLLVDNVQVGIVSYGFKMCNISKPTIYTRVSEYRRWISENIGENSASTYHLDELVFIGVIGVNVLWKVLI